MSLALAYALLRIRQHQAQSLDQQYRLHQLYLTFVAGQLTAEQYEDHLAPSPTKLAATLK